MQLQSPYNLHNHEQFTLYILLQCNMCLFDQVSKFNLRKLLKSRIMQDVQWEVSHEQTIMLLLAIVSLHSCLLSSTTILLMLIYHQHGTKMLRESLKKSFRDFWSKVLHIRRLSCQPSNQQCKTTKCEIQQLLYTYITEFISLQQLFLLIFSMTLRCN